MTLPTAVTRIGELLELDGKDRTPWIVEPGPYDVPVIVDSWGNRVMTGADSLKDSAEDTETRVKQYQLICLLRNEIEGLLEERERLINSLKDIQDEASTQGEECWWREIRSICKQALLSPESGEGGWAMSNEKDTQKMFLHIECSEKIKDLESQLSKAREEIAKFQIREGELLVKMTQMAFKINMDQAPSSRRPSPSLSVYPARPSLVAFNASSMRIGRIEKLGTGAGGGMEKY